MFMLDNYSRLLKEEITEEQLKELYKEFIDRYHDDIPENYLYGMDDDYTLGLDYYDVPCYIQQFYDEYDLIKEEYNMYNAFIQLIKHNHPDLSDKTILDIGGGIIPNLGRKLAKEAKHVIVIDRDITFKNNPNNLEVIKEEIDDDTKLPSADIIIGCMPCESTNYIVEHACKTNADFLIELCGCIHDNDMRNELSFYPDSFYYFSSKYQDKRKKYLMDKIKENNLGLYSEFGCSIPMPYKVVGNKRVFDSKQNKRA